MCEHTFLVIYLIPFSCVISNHNSVLLIFLQTWDDSLSEVAQNYADKCIFQHNSNRISQQSTFSTVGENLAATNGTVDYETLVLNWYNENANYNYNDNSCSSVCGHYTQVHHLNWLMQYLDN